MKWLILGAILLTSSCAINHRMSGEVDTSNDVNAKISITFPLCADHPEWTFEQLIECINACNKLAVEIRTNDELVQYLDALKEVQTGEASSTPVNVMGIY